VIRAEAEAYVKSIPRTWAIWIGLGDYETMTFDLVGYKQSDVGVYTDVTAPSMTGQPFIDSIAYVDKHPQVSLSCPMYCWDNNSSNDDNVDVCVCLL
jgi:hypothetical protein